MNEDLIRAIKAIAEDPHDRAKLLSLSTKQLARWERGKYPRVLDKLWACGVITINNPVKKPIS